MIKDSRPGMADGHKQRRESDLFRRPVLLMSRSEKIKNNLHRIECCERNLNEESVPVAHRTVPETRKFESLQFAALIALRTDESGVLINILEKVEALSLIIMETAYDIYRIEVRSI